MMTIAAKAKKQGNKLMECVLYCLACCVACLEKCVEYMNKASRRPALARWRSRLANRG